MKRNTIKFRIAKGDHFDNEIIECNVIYGIFYKVTSETNYGRTAISFRILRNENNSKRSGI